MRKTSKILEELHQIRETMHKETKGMSFEKKIRYWNERTDETLKKDGYKLETKGKFKILKKVK